MDYSSAKWGYKDYNKNNTVQHRAMRTFLGVGKYTVIPALYGELCWMTPHMRHQLDMIRLFVRLVNMRVETGQYRNIPRDLRLCTHCDLGAVEDEIHFVTECSLYDDNRRDLMNYINGDDELSRIELYTLMCVNIPPKILANFVLSGLIKRRNET